MNARGAMEIVVATIGLSLGILTPEMFSIIVMVAIVTSFLAPVGLRLTMPRVRMTEDEARRILASESTGAFDPAHVRVLLASGGGENALAAAPLAFGLARKSDAAVKIVHVAAQRSFWRRMLHPFRRRVSGSVTEQIEIFRGFATGRPPEIVHTSGPSVARAICDEARRGSDIIVVGSGEGPSIGGPVVEQLVGEAPCHVAIMKAPVRATEYQRILVPVDGSVASRLAVELALRYAEATGAELALAVMTERRPAGGGVRRRERHARRRRGARDQRRGAAADLGRVPGLGHQAEHPAPGVRSALERGRRGGRARAATIWSSSAPRTAPSSTGCSSATRTSGSSAPRACRSSWWSRTSAGWPIPRTEPFDALPAGRYGPAHAWPHPSSTSSSRAPTSRARRPSTVTLFGGKPRRTPPRRT